MNRISLAMACLGLLMFSGAKQSLSGQNSIQPLLRRPDDPVRQSAIPQGVSSPSHPIPGVSMIQDGLFRISGEIRPLGAASELLQRRLGVPVSYEDTAWPSLADLAASTGTLDVVVPSTPAASLASDPVKIIEQVLHSHVSFGNRGEFVLREFGEAEFTIVPAKVLKLNPADKSMDGVSPLDMKISFPQEERSLSETIALIYRVIKETGRGPYTGQYEQLSGRPLLAWDGPTIVGNHTLSYFKNTRVRVGANNEVARNVLAKALRIPGEHKISWSMLYVPNLSNYYLNLRPVQVEATNPNGALELTTVYWPKN